ncbi:hypothetical protein J1P26_07395 [Neobacillus sp. MM2021_6]|uniref:hypothetical protein n=1 Tax=Bacillaceae TaxID=186817 RepID=UPI00140A8F1A|nr:MULTISPECIES: hypothetical protein [Bacillaceae]MBO0959557.1 hypothetical protein [Neobacillus sp. MM2021_6]NHC17145.1 hypothetical protein [Bacillus sp. MM2020_4]
MEFIYGLLTAAVFFGCLFFFFWMGIRYGRQKKPPDKVPSKDTDEAVRKQKQLQQDFIKTMKYDVAQATARRKVTADE